MGKWSRIKPPCACGKPAVERKSVCADCYRARKREAFRARRAAYREQALCVHCGKSALPNASMCQPCGRKQALLYRQTHNAGRELLGSKYNPAAPKKLLAYATEYYDEVTPEAEAWILAHSDEWRERSDRTLWEHLQIGLDGDWTPAQPYWDRLGNRTGFEDYVIDRIDFARTYLLDRFQLKQLCATAGAR